MGTEELFMNYSYLQNIEKYEAGYWKENIRDIKISQEIENLNQEINGIDVSPLNFDTGDFVTVFISGVLGGLMDIFIGKPSGYKEPKIKDNSFFGLGKQLKEYDIKNNPIDKHLPGARVGDHRLYSYGHDLFRFNKGLQLIMQGKGTLGISGTGGEISLESIPLNYKTPEDMWEAALILLLHLSKDFWTARSLPIPGSTIIANLNNDEMPKIIHDLTNNNELNLRQITGQGLSIGVIEATNRLWLHFKYKNTDIPKDKITSKRDKMLLLAHSVAILFNIGKVIVTKNPVLLNIPQILRIVYLGWEVIKENAELTHQAIIKTNLSVMKNKYELMQTMILLDEAIYYTNEIDKFIVNKQDEFYFDFEKIELMIENDFDNLNSLLNQYKEINQKL